ncbi:MAG: polysaccharide deacetylase family protein [Oscillospiraceae bacterium]|nr:polysaccharide deacetylase family protein [Oscillospiraceae bacterium]
MKRSIFVLTLTLILVFTPVFSGAETARPDAESVSVPIIMYHSLLPQKTNEWNISPDAFAHDLRYLSENGYTTVFLSDLIAYVCQGVPLPEKPIVLTFDDGYYNNYSRGLPLLEEYNMKMVLAVIGTSSDHWTEHADEIDERYGHLTWPQIAEMSASGLVELANHTHNLHKNENGRKGCRKKEGEDPTAFAQMLTEDIEALQSRIEAASGERPLSFVYPFGAKCSHAEEVLRGMGFKVTLSCASGLNYLRVGDEDALFDMKRNNRTPDTTLAQILKKIA